MVHVDTVGDDVLTSSNAAPSLTRYSPRKVTIFDELKKLAASCETEESDTQPRELQSKDLDEIRKLMKPPVVVRRTLEATYLLLNAAKAPPRPSAPTWEQVQRMLSDVNFRTRMQSFDHSVLKEKPFLTAYVASEFFGGSDGSTPASKRKTISGADRLKRMGTRRLTVNFDEEEPLSFRRVSRASQASAALFKWSTTVLVEAMNPEVAEAEPVIDLCLCPAIVAAEPNVETAPIVQDLVEEPVLKLPEIKFSHDPLTRQVRPAPKPAPPPPPVFKEPRKVGVGEKPDRHFELMVYFELGRAGLADQGEPALQTVAATFCMRRRMTINLVGCPDPRENEAMRLKRIVFVREWLLGNGIPPASLLELECEKPRVASASGDPGVYCEMRLDDDKFLRDYYILLEEGEAPKDIATRDTINFAKWLEENFQSCKH